MQYLVFVVPKIRSSTTPWCLPTLYSQHCALSCCCLYSETSLSSACDTEAASECVQALEAVPGGPQACVSACDFQWCGGGLAVTDVMYLLWTSVQPVVIHEREDDLLQ